MNELISASAESSAQQKDTGKEIELEGGSIFFLVLHSKYQSGASSPLEQMPFVTPRVTLSQYSIVLCL